jgi:hypothetical protein
MAYPGSPRISDTAAFATRALREVPTASRLFDGPTGAGTSRPTPPRHVGYTHRGYFYTLGECRRAKCSDVRGGPATVSVASTDPSGGRQRQGWLRVQLDRFLTGAPACG